MHSLANVDDQQERAHNRTGHGNPWRWPVLPTVLAATAVMGNLNEPADYLKWGFIQVSPGNLVVILIMILLFVLALLLPFPKGKDDSHDDH
jgi:hypothetical protein